MPRALLRLLLLIPVLLVLGSVGLWVWATFVRTEEPEVSRVEVTARTAGGVTFEAEHVAGATDFGMLWGHDTASVRRGDDLLDYKDGELSLNGVGYGPLRPGDVVRWNIEGPLLVNGAPRQPHPHQPREIDPPHTDLRWDHRGGSPAPRDTLSVGWSRAGRVLIAANGDGVVRVWDPDKPAVTAALFHEPPKEGGRGGWGVRAAISPDGKTVASANIHGPDVLLWDVATGNKLATLTEPAGNVSGVRFLADGWLLEARGGTLYARRLAGDRSKVVPLGKVHQNFPEPIALSADGTTLAVNDGAKVTVFRLAVTPDAVTATPTGAAVEKLSGDSVVALSADGGLLAVFDGNGGLPLHDAATGAVLHRLRWRGDAGAAAQVGAMGFFPDGRTLAVADATTLRLYDTGSGRERGWFAAPSVRSLAFSRDGKTLAAGLRQLPGVRLWDAAALQERTKPPG